MILDFSAIKESKNLLAFSSGVDSTALFFLLLRENIPFDIAIVNYNLREQAKEELVYAKSLAQKHNKKIFIKELDLKNISNFEKKARDIRYKFFEELIQKHSYDMLITAHQLNDKLEWFLMQLSKGSGLIELLGMKTLEERKTYKIFRPLLNISKDELQNFLDKYSLKYFIDESNLQTKYKRNYFRHNFSNKFLEEFKIGIINSFSYLEKDLNSLNLNFKALVKIEELEIFKNLNDDNLNIKVIDKALKQRGILLSSSQRKEILKQKEATISHKINIAINEKYIYLAPKVTNTIPKKIKELYRINKIPKNIRAYLYLKNINIKNLVF